MSFPATEPCGLSKRSLNGLSLPQALLHKVYNRSGLYRRAFRTAASYEKTVGEAEAGGLILAELRSVVHRAQNVRTEETIDMNGTTILGKETLGLRHVKPQ